MPGTVQVIVLEFKGESSSSTPSAKSLKVSMGQRHYQTWDGGEFSFPITKLREDLVVALLDASENEIAHAEIRAMEIIEKGFWDEVFSISDIGNVHMQLQFTLSEKERNRIRAMREYAIKKKLETNPSINLRLLDTTASTCASAETSTGDGRNYAETAASTHDSVETSIEKGQSGAGPKSEASQAGLSGNSVTSPALPISSKQSDRGTFKSAVQVKELSLDTLDRCRSAPSSPGKRRGKMLSSVEHQRVPADTLETSKHANTKMEIENKDSQKLPDKEISVSSERENDSIQESKHESNGKEAPSSVRKMISAFENSRLQGVALMGSKHERGSLRKSLSVPSQLNRFRNKDSNIFTVDSSGTSQKELDEANGGVTRQSATGTAISSGSIRKEQSQVIESSKLSSKLLHSYESSAAEKCEIAKGSVVESSAVTVVQEALNMNPGSLKSYIEEILTVNSGKPPPKELEKETKVNLMKQPASGTPISSGRIAEEQSQVIEASQLSSKLLHSYESSAAEECETRKGSVGNSSAVAIVQETLSMNTGSLKSCIEEILTVNSGKPPPKELEKVTKVNLMRQPASGTPISSGRIAEEQSQVIEASQLSSKLLHSYESATAEESEKVKGSVMKSSTVVVVQEALDVKSKSLQPYTEDFFAVDPSEMRQNGLEEINLDLMRQSASRTAMNSGRMPEEPSQVSETSQPSSKILDSSEASAAEVSGSGSGSILKSSTMIVAQETLNMRPRSLASDSGQSSVLWTVEDNTGGLCITTAGEQTTEAHRRNESKDYHRKNISSSQASAAEVSGSGSGSGSRSILKSSTMIVAQETLNKRPRSLASDSGQISGMWIVADNTGGLCITTAGEQITEAHRRNESKDYHRKNISSSQASAVATNLTPGTENSMEDNLRITGDVPELVSGSSPDNSSNGLVGQVIKVAVILGFGALVLLTRQKKPLKKGNQEPDEVFPRSDYLDETWSRSW